MAGRTLCEVRALLGHRAIKLTEHYVHLASQSFVNAGSSTEGRLHFDSAANNNEQTQANTSPQVFDLMHRKWWALKDSNWLISY